MILWLNTYAKVIVAFSIGWALVLGAPGEGRAAFALLQWDPVSSSTPVGYKIHYGSVRGVYDHHLDAGIQTEAYIPFLEPGVTYYFAASCYSDGVESGYSNEIIYTPSTSDLYWTIGDARKDIGGWWYKANEPGTGFAIEVQDQTVFLVWYTYDLFTGEPTWISAHGQMVDPYRFDLQAFQWSGHPINSSYEPPTSQAIGSIQFELVSQNSAWLSWTIGDESGFYSLSKFLPSVSQYYGANSNLSGWWRDPDYDGTGVFVESGGDSIFIGWYLYRDDGEPLWYSTGGSFPDGSLSFQGLFEVWNDGQCIGCPYTFPTYSSASGDMYLTFFNDQKAQLEWRGLLLHLQRFNFESALP